MNKKINNEKEIKNKLKNFKEGADYSVFREGEKKIFNFHNNFLRDLFGPDYTTIYEVAESWDSDNFNHARAAAEYKNDKSHITYRYEHWINKDGNFNGEWSWGKNFKDNSGEIGWGLSARPNPNFYAPIVDIYEPVGEVENHRKNLAEFDEKKRLLKIEIEGLSSHIAREHPIADEKGREHEKELRKLEKELEVINEKIRYHEDWLVQNANREKAIEPGKDILPGYCCATCYKRISSDQGHYICKEHQEHHCSYECAEKWYKCHMEWVPGEKKDNHLVGCCNCGFKDIRLSDEYCEKCGALLCDEVKKPVKSDLEKENQELKKQLSEVKNQLKEVLEELKKLRNSSVGQNNAELDQQIDYNEKLISHVEVVPEAEIKEQVQKSQALLEKANVSVVPNKDNLGSGSLPYVIGGSVLVGATAIIGYYLWNRKKKNKVS